MWFECALFYWHWQLYWPTSKYYNKQRNEQVVCLKSDLLCTLLAAPLFPWQPKCQSKTKPKYTQLLKTNRYYLKLIFLLGLEYRPKNAKMRRCKIKISGPYNNLAQLSINLERTRIYISSQLCYHLKFYEPLDWIWNFITWQFWVDAHSNCCAFIVSHVRLLMWLGMRLSSKRRNRCLICWAHRLCSAK